MSFYKDLYIAELERQWAELEDQGVPTDKAYELAARRAYDRLHDLKADVADVMRERLKDEGQ
jgi:hypothetical protein